jgi:hypothetical protein
VPLDGALLLGIVPFGLESFETLVFLIRNHVEEGDCVRRGMGERERDCTQFLTMSTRPSSPTSSSPTLPMCPTFSSECPFHTNPHAAAKDVAQPTSGTTGSFKLNKDSPSVSRLSVSGSCGMIITAVRTLSLDVPSSSRQDAPSVSVRREYFQCETCPGCCCC